jgi:Zn ribbon nucleic-acid-binding protein
LKSVETEEYSLEVVECVCGFHLGVDFFWLDQIGDLKILCPACNREIDTEKIFTED